ncbi:hypothetical protein DL96DRAFT_1621765 [Flagelloscypha sp. PMI_526]|nr:hypothetical protein DL96DRAFT_1621765 [Flagelloscypha sp. PMI_526]
MDQVLHVAELCSLISFALSGDSVSLFRLALTCNWWKCIALETLYAESEVPIAHALRFLPPDIIGDPVIGNQLVMLRPIEEADLTRIFHRTRRIQHISTRVCKFELPWAFRTEGLDTYLLTGCLFLNVRSLNIEPSCMAGTARLFLGPKVKTLTILSKWKMEDTLIRARRECSGIRRFELQSHNDGPNVGSFNSMHYTCVVAALAAWRELSYVDLHIPKTPIGPDLLLALAVLPNLTHLSIRYLKVSLNLPSSSNLIDLLTSFGHSPLTSLSLTFMVGSPDRPDMDPTPLQSVLEPVAHYHTLKSIFIEHYPLPSNRDPPLTIFRPLLGLYYLETIDLRTSYVCSFEDEDLNELKDAWPYVTSLALGSTELGMNNEPFPFSHGTGWLTLEGLTRLVATHPHLTRVNVAFSALWVPYSPSSHDSVISMSLRSLYVLQDCPIGRDVEEEEVARYLAHHFPNLENLVIDNIDWSEWSGVVEHLYYSLYTGER